MKLRYPYLLTIQMTFRQMRMQKLIATYPILFILFLTLFLMISINTFSPLVPFVYSLF